MNEEVIKSFLVGLGFQVDSSSLGKFNEALKSAALRVTGLFVATKAMAAGVAYGISQVSESFEQMGYEYRIIAPAMNKALLLRQAMLSAYKAAGVNIVKVVQQSVLLNYSLARTKFAFEAIYKSVAAKFFPLLTKQSDALRQKLFANMPAIQAALEKFVNFTFKAFDVLTDLGLRVWQILSRVWDFFKRLHESTNGWSTAILAAVAAWKFLNLSFLATPLGMLLAGFAALVALWDDFMTFEEGGRSFINWGSDTTKMIVGMVAAIAGLSAAIVTIASVYNLWKNGAVLATAAQYALNLAMSLNPIGLIIAGVTALIGLFAALDAKWNVFGGHVTDFFKSIGSGVMNFLSPSAQAPLGSDTTNNNQVSQRLQMNQTNYINGGNAQENASAIGGTLKSASGDFVRNLAPRAR